MSILVNHVDQTYVKYKKDLRWNRTRHSARQYGSNQFVTNLYPKGKHLSFVPYRRYMDLVKNVHEKYRFNLPKQILKMINRPKLGTNYSSNKMIDLT